MLEFLGLVEVHPLLNVPLTLLTCCIPQRAISTFTPNSIPFLDIQKTTLSHLESPSHDGCILGVESIESHQHGKRNYFVFIADHVL